MWKIYVILALSTEALNAQHSISLQNSRGGSVKERGSNKFHPSDIYPESEYMTHLTTESNNSVLNAPPLSNQMYSYNTNSRNSYKRVTDLGENSQFQAQEMHFGTTTPQTINAAIWKPLNFSSTQEIQMENSFNSKLFQIMSSKSQQENLLYSPISLQTFLAFIFTMADGKLNEELSQLLAIPNNGTFVAKKFENILRMVSLNSPPTIVILANKLYYDYRFGPIDHNIRNLAKTSFASEFEQIDFLVPKKAANAINLWVSEKTHNLISDIVSPTSITVNSSALLVNSIYFKSEWLTKFATYDTEIQDFFVTKQKKISIDMMYNEDVFRYGDFSEDLHASVVELPYKTSNLSMLLILPQDIDGLMDLEQRLRNYDFETISRKLKRETVTVKLPKFKIEFESDMIKTLRELGLNALFNNVGTLNIFNNHQKPFAVDQFKHKCFISVNEAGTEAAAATVAKYVPLSIPINMKYFIADHPFLFVIRDSSTTFFIGHVVQL